MIKFSWDSWDVFNLCSTPRLRTRIWDGACCRILVYVLEIWAGYSVKTKFSCLPYSEVNTGAIIVQHQSTGCVIATGSKFIIAALKATDQPDEMWWYWFYRSEELVVLDFCHLSGYVLLQGFSCQRGGIKGSPFPLV